MEFYTWDEMEKEVLSDTIARKIISGDKAMVAQVFLAKGAIVPEHHHESEQITYILEGALQVRDRRAGHRRRQGAGAAHSLQRAAPRRGARRHAGSRHLQPDPRGLDQEGRRVPAGLNWRPQSPISSSARAWRWPARKFAALRRVLPRWAIPVTAGLFAVAPDLDTWVMMALDIPRGSLFSHRGVFHSPFFLSLLALGIASLVARGRARLPVGSRVGRRGDHSPAPRHAYRRRLRRDAVFPVLHGALLLSLAADPRLPPQHCPFLRPRRPHTLVGVALLRRRRHF